MKIETQTLEDHQVKLTVEVEPEALEDAKQRAARQMAKRVKIPGFRPGKAPFHMIVRQLGEPAILEEAMELLVNDIYPKVIEESGVKAYGPGILENVTSTEPPVLEFIVPLEAQVTLGDYQAIQRPYEPKDITEEDIEEILDNLRERQVILEPVERPAQEGDLVTIRLSGKRLNAEEGESNELVQERSVPIQIKAVNTTPPDDGDNEDEKEPDEWPFPGFSRQLIGLAPEDERTVNHTFSEESTYESLRGVEAEFHFVVENVKARILPELNDEFANSVGEYETLEMLREEIRKSLESQAKETYNQEYDEAVLDEAVGGATIKYPPQMLEREIDDVIANFKNRLQQQNMDLDLYLKTRSMDEAAFREEARPAAEKRLKQHLVLMEIAQAEKVQVEPDELQTETMRTVNSLSQTLPKKEARKLNNRNVFSNLVTSIMVDMLTHKSLERLRQIASGQTIDEENANAEEPMLSTEGLDNPASIETSEEVVEPVGEAVEALEEQKTESSSSLEEASDAGESAENPE